MPYSHPLSLQNRYDDIIEGTVMCTNTYCADLHFYRIVEKSLAIADQRFYNCTNKEINSRSAISDQRAQQALSD